MSDDELEKVPHWNDTSAVARSEIREFILRGQTVSAITLYRQIHGIGLAEAKLAIESLICASFKPGMRSS